MKFRKLASCIYIVSVWASVAAAQQSTNTDAPLSDRERALLDRIDKLEQRVAALEGKQPNASASTPASAPQPQSPPNQAAAPQQPSSPLAFSDSTTLNFLLDGYYGYNFDHPVGRVNLLRFNDPTSNNFTLDQAVVMLERAPDASAGRRLGIRLDLMFGQDTDSLQGSSANEPRPQIYRNIFQAYGSYVFPAGSGLQVDFGKFASSIGYEGAYAKDQLNYSRSLFYTFLPAYHMGFRANYNVNSKLSLQYWLVNGLNQTEDFNGFKSQAAVIIVKPNSNITWNINYYEGREQRDLVPLTNPGVPELPTQPGLSITPVQTAHNGRLHIIDSYVSFNLGPKWTTGLEGDYVISRVASNSFPTRLYGGVGYLHRQISNAFALNGRFEYLKDDGGLFTGVTQDLKDITGTAVYQFADGFQTRLEYRRDFTNRPFFLTNNPAVLVRSQSTATLGMLWWIGGKQGSW
ncbi:MAG: outer membrane beta-barrel protein [Acidobacteriaceae bacterium]|nr:outer membrane beta-barrel protein [Acidobacteriaceae bacterium]MBV9294394.1 outer membrane beta-barrel protein [Acidobacteriaceae bacterium]MBV9765057.1 outer membrane beta-barrel protein [Acidobacteriaceae bacterium]